MNAAAKPVRIIPRPVSPPPQPPAAISVKAPAAKEPQNTAPIAQFIDLEVEARRCADLAGLKFAIVNSSRKIAEFEQSFLVEKTKTGQWQISLASSVSKIDHHAPLIRSLNHWLQHERHAEHMRSGKARIVNIMIEALEWQLSDFKIDAPFVMWLPIKGRSGAAVAALLALKSEAWKPQHSALMIPLADVYGHAWEALVPQSTLPLRKAWRKVFHYRSLLAALLIGCAFIPINLSVLAPSEVVAAHPALITAPMDGAIDDVLVAPGTWVDEGDVIIKLNDVKLNNDFEAAKRRVELADAKYLNFLQSSLANQEQTDQLSSAEAELNIAKAELTAADDQLYRTNIRAPRSGLLIYSAKSDLLGKPVVLGERLMEVGDPDDTLARIDVPVSDAIALNIGNPVSLFLDGDPSAAVNAKIASVSYRPVLNAEQQLVFRIFAQFPKGKTQRIGLHAMGRIEGEKVRLYYYLFRRPIAALRQKFGL